MWDARLVKVEGVREAELSWRWVAWIALLILVPLFAALFFDSYWLKAIFWVIAIIAYRSGLLVWGAAATAIGVSGLPLYAYLEWDGAPRWILYPIIIWILIEISYIRHQVRVLTKRRKAREDTAQQEGNSTAR